jgi:hypothetical protein
VNTTRQRAIVQKARKVMRQLMQGREGSSTARTAHEELLRDGGDRKERLSSLREGNLG